MWQGKNTTICAANRIYLATFSVFTSLSFTASLLDQFRSRVFVRHDFTSAMQRTTLAELAVHELRDLGVNVNVWPHSPSSSHPTSSHPTSSHLVPSHETTLSHVTLSQATPCHRAMATGTPQPGRRLWRTGSKEDSLVILSLFDFSYSLV